MDDLREALFGTIDALRQGKMDIETAKAITGVAQTLVNSAKVEVEYVRATGTNKGTGFLEAPDEQDPLPPGVTGRTVHRIR